MEVLVQELAKILNVTVEKAVELYPLLKSQFIHYRMLGVVNGALVATAITSGAVVVLSGALFAMNAEWMYSESQFDERVYY